jgi:hypothetical protein
MPSGDFERLAVDHTHAYVSICRCCLQFIAAAPNLAQLAIVESQHHCSRTSHGMRKPPASVAPGRRQAVSTRF